MPVGMSDGIGRFGVSGPPNMSAPSGANPVTNNTGSSTPWYASGPVWTIIFLIVGYLLVYQTVK